MPLVSYHFKIQIFSESLCEKIEVRAIDIHHTFLPSFIEARPYHQAHSRGVKVIGATAHYVTSACFSPTLNKSVGLGLVERGLERAGEVVHVYARHGTVAARIVSPAHYDPAGERMRD